MNEYAIEVLEDRKEHWENVREDYSIEEQATIDLCIADLKSAIDILQGEVLEEPIDKIRLEKENAELKKQLKDTEEELLSLDRINTDLEEKNIKLKSITEQDIVDVLKKYSEFSAYYDHKIIRGVGFDEVAKAIIKRINDK
jgi:xylose isomerase